MTFENRKAALETIRQTIAERGFHQYGVVGGGVPQYGYTIGLSESLGAELVLPGAYYFTLDEVEEIITAVACEVGPPAAWESRRIVCGTMGSFSLRKVHLSWSKSLMLGVFDYYQMETIQAYQIVPHETHWALEIPDLSQPWSPELAPSWRWLHEPWTYPVPKDSVALTDLGALRRERVTEAVRWENDEWEIFAGAGPDIPEAERRVVPLAVLLGNDASLVPVVDLPIGAGLWRDTDSEWQPWVGKET